MSNFKDVYTLNSVFQKPTTNSDMTDYTVIESQLALIKEEFSELEDAVANRDWEGLKDAIGDVLVTAYGMGYAGQFDCDLLMKNISKSNMSKVCRTMDQARKTRLYYLSIGVSVDISTSHIIEPFLFFFKRKVPVYIVKSAKDQTYTENGTEKSIRKGKFLKNIDWHEPDLKVDFKHIS